MNKAKEIERLIKEIIEDGNQEVINEAALIMRKNMLKSYRSEPIPEYGDVYEIDYFMEKIEPFGDGSWDYSDGTMIYPDTRTYEERFTHIVYYSK
jgi:hypothetical protein